MRVYESGVQKVTSIAVVGVGRVGSAIARLAVSSGYDVTVSASGPADDIELLASIVIPGAIAMTTRESVARAAVAILAVPLSKYRSVDPALLAGKIVVDAMNYWAPVDGHIVEFDHTDLSSSEVVARYFTSSRVVKTFNHIGYHEIEDEGAPAGTPERRALAVASDYPDATRAVMAIVDRFGFDPVDAGPLANGRLFQPGTPIFNGSFTRKELEHELGLCSAIEA